jgi:DMSO/TMAO reductase YedYZ heme-binding membrane subunit
LHGPGLWYVTRATGLVSLVLLTVSVLLGLLVAGRFTSDRWPRFLTQGLHRNLSMLVLVFLALHIGATVLDTYTSISLTAAFVPFASSYKTVWLSLGAVALDLLIALIVTSLVRSRLGYRTWRRLHWLVYACWPVAVAHGLGIGTDRSATWVIALTLACMGCVAAVGTWRAFTLRAQLTPERNKPSEHSGSSHHSKHSAHGEHHGSRPSRHPAPAGWLVLLRPGGPGRARAAVRPAARRGAAVHGCRGRFRPDRQGRGGISHRAEDAHRGRRAWQQGGGRQRL